MTTRAPPTLNYFTAPTARRSRFVAWVMCVSTLIAGLVLWMFLLRGERILRDDLILICGWAVLGANVFAVHVLVTTTPLDAIRVTPTTSRCVIIGGAALLQGLAIWLLLPGLSEDVLRYRVDGRLWTSGVSPYTRVAPDYLDIRLDAIDMLTPFKELPTIYPPTAQVAFTTARLIEDALPRAGEARYQAHWRLVVSSISWLHRATILRITAAAFGLGCVILLLSILRHDDRSAWYAVLFGWSPLIAIETGGMGHVDIVGVLFVLLTVRTLQAHRPILATAMLALASGVKPHVVLLAPFLVRDALAAWHGISTRVGDVETRVENPCHERSGRRIAWLAFAFVGFLALVYSPMLYQQGYKGWLRTSHVYATSWEANGSIYDLIKASADPTDGVAVQRAKDRARLLAGAAVIVTMLLAWFGRADLVTAGYWIFLVALLFSPVVYPWYLLWVLCFVPLLRGWQGMTALVWAATVGVSYLLWRTSDWVLPTRWLLVEYVPVYAALLTELAMLLFGSLNHRSIETLKRQRRFSNDSMTR